MDFELDHRTRELATTLREFLDNKVAPAEEVFTEQVVSAPDRWAWSRTPVLLELRAEARSEGLWNLFLPVSDHGNTGAGLTNLQYAPLAELSGTSAEQQVRGRFRKDPEAASDRS